MTSAKYNKGIDELFESIAKKLYENFRQKLVYSKLRKYISY